MLKGHMARREFLAQAAGLTALPRDAEPQAEGGTPPLPPAVAMHDLHQTVLAARPRIGRPVFVRYTRLGQIKNDDAAPRLATMLGEARSWVGQPPRQVYARGTAAKGQVCLAVQFRGGATGLLSVGRGSIRGDGFDLMVLGSRGAITYDGGTGPLWDAPAPPGGKPPDAKLLAAVERTLRSGRPEVLQDG